MGVPAASDGSARATSADVVVAAAGAATAPADTLEVYCGDSSCRGRNGPAGRGFCGFRGFNIHVRHCHNTQDDDATAQPLPPPTDAYGLVLAPPPPGPRSRGLPSSAGPTATPSSAPPPAAPLPPFLPPPLLPNAASLPPPPRVRADSATPDATDRRFALGFDFDRIKAATFRVATDILPRHHSEHRACITLISDLLASEASGELGVILMHVFPLLCHRLGPRGGHAAQQTRQRLLRFARGDWYWLLAEAWHDVVNAPPPPPRPPPPETQRQHTRAGRDAAALASRGQFSKAVNKALCTAVLAPVTPDVIASLQALHPDEHGFDGTAWDEDYCQHLRDFRVATGERLIVSEADVHEVFANADPTSAGGLSGLTVGLLTPVLLRDAHVRSQFAKFFQRLVDGDSLSGRIRSLLGGCRLIPLAKDTGKLRPIAVGEILRRLCGRIVLKKVRAAILRKMEPHQLGVGSRCGGEAMSRAATLYLEDNPDNALVHTDQTNAFNCMSRVATFQELEEEPELRALIPFLRLWYDGDSELFIAVPGSPTSPAVVYSKTGAQQGCTFGSVMYALGWQKALLKAAALAGITLTYVDDGVYGCRMADVSPLLGMIELESARRGGQLNYGKSLVFSPARGVTADVRVLGVRCIDVATPSQERGFVICGIPLGHPHFVEAWLEVYVARQQADLAQIVKTVPDSKAVLQMIVYCIRPRANHLLRSLPPDTVRPFAERLDRLFGGAFLAGGLGGQSAAESLRDATPEPALARALRQLHLKLRDGGLCPAIAPAAPAAYTASAYDTRPLLLRLLPATVTSQIPPAPLLLGNPPPPNALPSLRHLHAAASSLPQQAQDVLARLNDADPAAAPSARGPPAPPDPMAPAASAAQDDASPPSGKNLQAKLSRSTYAQLTVQHSESIAADKPEAARFLSVRGYLGTAWMQPTNSGEYRLSNRDVSTAVLLHLNLPLLQFQGASCACGRSLDPSATFAHFESCNRVSKAQRSESFGTAFDDVMISAGGTVTRAQAGLAGGGPGPGPYATSAFVDAITGELSFRDIYFDRYVSNLPQLIGRGTVDYVISDPQCTSYSVQGQAATVPLWAAGKAHEQKLLHYGPHMKPGDTIMPVSVEVWGGVHEFVHKLLVAWVGSGESASHAEGASANRGRRAQVLCAWQRHLSFGLLRGRLGIVAMGERVVFKTAVKSGSRKIHKVWSDPVSRVELLGGRFA